MDHLPVNKNVKFAKLLSTNPRFANLSQLAVIAVATTSLVIVSGLLLATKGPTFRGYTPSDISAPATPPKSFC